MTLLRKLIDRFKNYGYRHAYVESFLDSYIATQIKVLREQRHLTQSKLATMAHMKQSQISALEDVNHSAWKISTLKKLARAFDLVLIVRFETFGKVLPDIDSFARDQLQRHSFADDPAFSPVIYAESGPMEDCEVSDEAPMRSLHGEVMKPSPIFSMTNRAHAA